jgi:hypothetical protein
LKQQFVDKTRALALRAAFEGKKDHKKALARTGAATTTAT